MNNKKKIKKIFKPFHLLLILCMLTLSGCGLPGLSATGDDTIVVSSMGTSESQILAYMIIELIEHETDYPVDLMNNLGSAYVNQQALENNDADITAARYTGTDWVAVLGKKPTSDTELITQTIKTEFKNRYGYKYYDTYGFPNTYVFMVTKETAEKYNLSKVSDLKNVADELRAGFDVNWLNREGDGYEGFVKTYQFDFKNRYPMQLGLVYDALAAGKMDVVLGYSTDGRISSYDLVLLEDDLNFFPPYDTCAVANDRIINDYPEIDELIERLVGKIDIETMQHLNYIADHHLVEPQIVARDFLKENNYFRGEN